jgi:hypothetical protein
MCGSMPSHLLAILPNLFAKEMIPNADSYLRIASIYFEGFFDYMWIGASEKFLVCATVTNIDPFRTAAVPVHFMVIRPNEVKVKLAGYVKWVTHGVRRDEEILWWTIRDKDVPWTFVSFEDVPQWAHDVFARGKAKLEKDEQSEQFVGENPS